MSTAKQEGNTCVHTIVVNIFVEKLLPGNKERRVSDHFWANSDV